MQWYEIALGIVAWIIGLCIYGKFKNYNATKYHNDSWKNKPKK